MDREQRIRQLERFKAAYYDWEMTARPELRSELNKTRKLVEREVIEARCLKRLTISPPPAVGGLMMRNINPFDMMFEQPYGLSLAGTISDMIDETIGVISVGEDEKQIVSQPILDTDKEGTPIMNKSLEYPEKITLKWLWHNVPYTFWIWFVSTLCVAFLFGVSIGQSKLYQDLMTKNDAGQSSLEKARRAVTAPALKTNKAVLNTEEENRINNLMYEFGSLGINLQAPAKCADAEYMRRYNKAKLLLSQIESRSKAIGKYSQYAQFLSDNKQWIHSTADDCQ